MATSLWMELRQFAQKMAWPTAKAATPESRVVYEAGLDIVNSYSGDPACSGESVDAVCSVPVGRLCQRRDCGCSDDRLLFARGYLRPKRLAGSRTVLAGKHKRRFPIEPRSIF